MSPKENGKLKFCLLKPSKSSKSTERKACVDMYLNGFRLFVIICGFAGEAKAIVAKADARAKSILAIAGSLSQQVDFTLRRRNV